MAEGVTVVCKKGLSEWIGNSSLLMGQPYAVINSAEKTQLVWDKEVFVPLMPNMPYQIAIQWPHPVKKACNVATINLSVKEGEIQRFEYKVPASGIGSGKIKKLN